MIRFVVAITIVCFANAAFASAPVEDRLAVLEKEAETLHSIYRYAAVVATVLGIGGVGAILGYAKSIRDRIRTTFERQLADHGLSWADLSEVVRRGEQQVRVRKSSSIVVVAPDARRDLQVALQREGFHRVAVHGPGQPAVEAARLADLVVTDGWGEWAEQLVRDLGRDDILIYTGPLRADVPKDLAPRVMLANAHLTLGLHSAALLVRADARQAA